MANHLTQVDPATVASDSFMFNLQSVLYNFANPFIDATYSKVNFFHFDRRLVLITRYLRWIKLILSSISIVLGLI